MKYFIIAGILLIGTVQVKAQCCSAGNPVNTDFNLGNTTNSLKIFTTYRHSLSTDYFKGNSIDTNSSVHSIDRSFFDFQSLGVSYQYKKVNVKAMLGYYFNKDQEFFNGYDREAYGWGDLELSVSYNLSSLFKNKISFIPSFGTILPTGTFDLVVDNINLPIDVQPSAGALKINGGFLLAKSFLNKKLNIFSYNLIEYSQTIESEKVKSYKYGNIYVNSLGSAYKLNDWLSPVFQIRSEYREKSVDKSIVMNSTGGHILYAAAKLNLKHNSFGGNIGLDVPIYKNINGIQLTNKFMFNVGLSYQIDFRKVDSPITELEAPEINDLQNLQIEVRGACGMCKDRIEKIALNIKNIDHANYNIAEQKLIIYYKKQPDINKLILGLKTAGHDNEYGKATDEAYKNLHGCCKYER